MLKLDQYTFAALKILQELGNDEVSEHTINSMRELIVSSARTWKAMDEYADKLRQEQIAKVASKESY
jgi:hypothetical protein